MWNFEHEIDCPDDKAIKSFLWVDYFHDSKILNIDFSEKQDKVTITVDCARDREDELEKLKGDDAEKKAFIDEHKDQFVYKLTFDGCKVFNCEKIASSGEFLNGRFKNSVILQKMKAADFSDYYHFRIQLVDGYIDLVFRKFIIRKLIGRMRYDDFENIDYKISWLKNFKNSRLLASNGSLNVDKVLELAKTGNDIERQYALTYLAFHTKLNLVETARTILSLGNNFDMAKIISIFILGEQSDESDVPMLMLMYFDIERKMSKADISINSTLLPKRHIMDAIEKIKYRKAKKYKIHL